ncbi:UNVERIFIED_CONTAM: hypothetical protein RMT77_000823 [Armadillidium vulgare]
MSLLIIFFLFHFIGVKATWRSHHVSFLSSRPNANVSMIKIRRFNVPRYIPMEEDVQLECDYAVEGESALYSLKWYKGGSQFYEFIPSKVRKHTIFPTEGLSQDKVQAAEDGRIVTLKEVGTGASDQYRCELVAEGPPFHTTQRQDNLTVVVLPRGPPELSGSKEFYHSHDFIVLNCTPPLSKPAAATHWFVNGNPSDPSLVRDVSHYVNPAGLESITSQLRLEVHKANFYNGKLNIRCEATLAHIYRKSSHISILEPSGSWFVSSNLYLTSGCEEVCVKKNFTEKILLFLGKTLLLVYCRSKFYNL